MNEKKTAVITFRTDKKTKEALENIANKREWTIAQTVNRLCKDYVENPQPNTINLKATELYEYVDKLKEDTSIEAVEVNIYTYEGEDNIVRKYFSIDILECGGLVLAGNDEALTEMSSEEIEKIN